MAGQTKSGFSTEGTQYSLSDSYYLLDSVPGAGDVLQGPITVTGNLTTTGNETVLGSLGVIGNVNAPSFSSSGVLTITGGTGATIASTTGNVALQANGSGNISLFSAGGGITANGNTLTASLTGQVTLASGSAFQSSFTMTPTGNIDVTAFAPTGYVQLRSAGGVGGTSSTLTLGSDGNTNLVCSRTFTLDGILALQPHPGMGTPSTPVAYTATTTSEVFTMIGNKLYITTTGSTTGTFGTVYIALPNATNAGSPPFVIALDGNGASVPLTGTTGVGLYYNTVSPSPLVPNQWYFQQPILGQTVRKLNLFVI
jgi:hypothetical protein